MYWVYRNCNLCAGGMTWVIIERFVVVSSRQTSSKLWFSTGVSESDNDVEKNNREEEEYDDMFDDKIELQPQGVDPRRGWGFRGVHKVFDLCPQMRSIFRS